VCRGPAAHASGSCELAQIENAKVDLLQEKQPSKDFVTPEQIGALICFLCSDSAVQITGAALNIYCGWLAL